LDFNWYKALLGLLCLFAVSACPSPKGACWDSGAAGELWVGQAFFFMPGEDAAAFFVGVAVHADLQKWEVLGKSGREGKVAGPNSYFDAQGISCRRPALQRVLGPAPSDRVSPGSTRGATDPRSPWAAHPGPMDC